MGVTNGCLGGLTPICNVCGITLCFEIDPVEYEENTDYWENWCCEECAEYTRKEYLEEQGKKWYPTKRVK
ncbi:MAG: hypothetical protein ACOC44_16485 [Promethearchaeia archaeon]